MLYFRDGSISIVEVQSLPYSQRQESCLDKVLLLLEASCSYLWYTQDEIAMRGSARATGLLRFLRKRASRKRLGGREGNREALTFSTLCRVASAKPKPESIFGDLIDSDVQTAIKPRKKQDRVENELAREKLQAP